MGYQPIEDLLPKAGGSVYKLVRLASDRAIELADGKKALVDLPLETKTATAALEEIREAKVVLKDVADEFAPEPKEEGKRKKQEEPEAREEEE